MRIGTKSADPFVFRLQLIFYHLFEYRHQRFRIRVSPAEAFALQFLDEVITRFNSRNALGTRFALKCKNGAVAAVKRQFRQRKQIGTVFDDFA